MPALRVPTQSLAAALQALKGGATLADAAKANGVSVATLKRHRAAAKQKLPAARPKPPPPTATPPRALAGLPSAEVKAVDRETDEGAPSLLDTLHAELVEARAQRQQATEDAARRGWSKRVEELVKCIERLAPPAPVPPDAVEEALRKMDGVCRKKIEEFTAASDAALERRFADLRSWLTGKLPDDALPELGQRLDHLFDPPEVWVG